VKFSDRNPMATTSRIPMSERMQNKILKDKFPGKTLTVYKASLYIHSIYKLLLHLRM
jgi:hypothetical protein